MPQNIESVNDPEIDDEAVRISREEAEQDERDFYEGDPGPSPYEGREAPRVDAAALGVVLDFLLEAATLAEADAKAFRETADGVWDFDRGTYAAASEDAKRADEQARTLRGMLASLPDLCASASKDAHERALDLNAYWHDDHPDESLAAAFAQALDKDD